jgi:hypothetical protein
MDFGKQGKPARKGQGRARRAPLIHPLAHLLNAFPDLAFHGESTAMLNHASCMPEPQGDLSAAHLFFSRPFSGGVVLTKHLMQCGAEVVDPRECIAVLQILSTLESVVHMGTGLFRVAKGIESVRKIPKTCHPGIGKNVGRPVVRGFRTGKQPL